MDKIISIIIQNMKIVIKSSKYLIIPTGFILFCPERYLDKFKIIEIKNNFSPWITLIFLLSISVIIIDIIQIIINKIKDRYKLMIQWKNFDNIMFSLNNSERKIIFEIYKNDSASFPICDALITKLNIQRVIERPTVGIPGSGIDFLFCLQPWVVTWLKKHPDYFDGSEQKYTT
jgi:hypothetical protein